MKKYHALKSIKINTNERSLVYDFFSKNKSFAKILSLLILSLLLISCASLPGEHKASIKSAQEGDYEKSLEFIDKKKKTIYGNKSEVLYELDTGILNHYNQNWQASIKHFSEAETKIYELYTKSITAQIGSFILNDSVLDYSGEDYEDIYLNVFNSLNYYHLGKIDDAIVETNRAINKSKNLTIKYEEEILKARNATKEAEEKNGKKSDSDSLPKASITFHDSALVEYLAMLYRRGILDMDGAYTNQRMIKDAYMTQAQLYDFEMPASVNEELSIPKDKARLNVIAFSGISPVKDEITIKDYSGYSSYSFSLALPELIKNPYTLTDIHVTATNVETGEVYTSSLELLESLENVAVDTFLLHRDVIYAKSIARAITKSIASDVGMVVGEEMSKSGDSNVAAVGSLIQIFTMVGNVSRQVTDHADMRISRYFPARASVTGINLDEGIYDIVIDYYEKNHKLVRSDIRENIVIKKGKLNLIESAWLGGN
ncbi:MAG: hypothetical protein PUC37_01495 [Spirochaetales bacterium]|nr:hypothetical protein [Spirochaetales bacterium]